MPIAQTGLSVTADQGQQKPLEVASNLSEGLKAGMQLATVQDQVDSMKAKVEEQKLELQQKQFSSVTSMLKNLAIANPKVGKLMTPRVKENMIKMGFDPNIADYITSDDASRARFVNIANLLAGKIANNPPALAEALQSLTDVGDLDKAITTAGNAYKAQQQNAQFYAGLQNQKDIAGMNTQAKVATTQARLGPQEERIHNKILDSIKTDKAINTRVTQIQNLNNAVSNFTAGGASPTDFHELQQAVRANLGIKGQSGVSERADSYLKSAGLSVAEFKQFLTSDMADVNNYSPQFVKHIMALANNELANANTQLAASVNKHVKGHEHFYSSRPELKQDLLSYAEGTTAQAQPAQPSASTSTAQPQGGFDQAKFQEALQRQIKARQGK